MSGKFSFFDLTADWGDDHSGTVFVACIVLDNKDRSETILGCEQNLLRRQVLKKEQVVYDLYLSVCALHSALSFAFH